MSEAPHPEVRCRKASSGCRAPPGVCFHRPQICPPSTSARPQIWSDAAVPCLSEPTAAIVSPEVGRRGCILFSLIICPIQTIPRPIEGRVSARTAADGHLISDSFGQFRSRIPLNKSWLARPTALKAPTPCSMSSRNFVILADSERDCRLGLMS